MSNPILITIREATLSDVVGMAEVTSQGFMDDNLFGSFMHPKRKELPTDWHYFWQQEIRTQLAHPANTTYVAVDEPDPSDRGHIAAICIIDRLRISV